MIAGIYRNHDDKTPMFLSKTPPNLTNAVKEMKNEALQENVIRTIQTLLISADNREHQ